MKTAILVMNPIKKNNIFNFRYEISKYTVNRFYNYYMWY